MSEPDRVLEFLCDPRSYPHDAAAFEAHETHISRVFLAGPFAYKIKKAVSLGFLDYSTAERRRRFCEEEVRLNRRLAPSIYLGVVSIRECDGRLFLDLDGSGRERAGREVEAAVRMNRVPRQAMLDSLVRERLAGQAHIDQLVDLMAAFYREAPVVKPSDRLGSPEALRRTIRENFESTRDLAGALIPAGRFHAARSAQLGFLALREEIFHERARAGRIRDGHGDLRAEHVVFLPGPAVMDCIEFNDTLRCIDAAADLAFLKMDLEFLGAPHLGNHLIDRYVEVTGDDGLREVLPFYLSYRAWVRGKVAGIKMAQLGIGAEEKEMLIRRSIRYFELAHYHALTFHRPLLVLTGGLSGTGKTTLARGLADRLGAPLLRSDEVRKQLAGLKPLERRGRGFLDGIYSEAFTRRTYGELAERARALLVEGATVVVDATFSLEEQRRLLRTAARETGARAVHFECRIPPALASERLRLRAQKDADASDAGPEIQAIQAVRYELPAPCEAVPLEADAPPAAVLDAALEALRRIDATP